MKLTWLERSLHSLNGFLTKVEEAIEEIIKEKFDGFTPINPDPKTQKLLDCVQDIKKFRELWECVKSLNKKNLDLDSKTADSLKSVLKSLGKLGDHTSCDYEELKLTDYEKIQINSHCVSLPNSIDINVTGLNSWTNIDAVPASKKPEKNTSSDIPIFGLIKNWF